MRKSLLPGVVALGMIVLAGCTSAEEPEAAPSPTVVETTVVESPAPTETVTVTETPAPETQSPIVLPEQPNTDPVPIPTDCQAILTPEVLEQLKGIPLNHEAHGDTVGVLPDGSLMCVWGDPAADATGLSTHIFKGTPHEQSLVLSDAQKDGMTCTELENAVRCESSESHPDYPVDIGRTLYMRGGVAIDTQYSNLAPEGYTDAIVNAMWPTL